MRLSGKHVAYLLGPEFEDLEFWVPLMRLREEGAVVDVLGLKAGVTYTGKYGVPATAEFAVGEADAAEYVAVVIPGGWAPDKLRRDPGVLRFVRAMYDDRHIIGMICHAGLVGISAGIVSGHEATGSEGIKDDLLNAGALWRDVPALRSGPLVWGRVVADIPDFCRELIAAIQEA
jgi:protease I